MIVKLFVFLSKIKEKKRVMSFDLNYRIVFFIFIIVMQKKRISWLFAH